MHATACRRKQGSRGMEEISWLRFVLAFAFVLGLLGLFAMAMRKWGGRFSVYGGNTSTSRLSVVEMRNVGPRHRLVLVKRDAVEHLLLIAPESVTLVEGGIRADEK